MTRTFLGFVFLILLLALWLLPPGCTEPPVVNPAAPMVVVSPQTHFTPPTTVPSVTAAARAATTQASAVQAQATESYAQVAGLLPTPAFETAKAQLVAGMQRLLGGIAAWCGYSQQAEAQSQANDAAVLLLQSRLADTEHLVGAREQQISDNAKAYAQGLQGKDASWQGRYDVLAQDRDAWKNKCEAANANMLRWIWGSTVGLGVLLLLGSGAVIYLTWSTGNIKPGLFMAAMGGLAISLGVAGAKYDAVIGIVGLALGGLALLIGIILAIIYLVKHYKELLNSHAAAAIQIADGVQQAVNAGAIDLSKAKVFLDQAQGPLARKLVDAAVKTHAELVASANPYIALTHT